MEVSATVDAGQYLVPFVSLLASVARRASTGTVDCCFGAPPSPPQPNQPVVTTLDAGALFEADSTTLMSREDAIAGVSALVQAWKTGKYSRVECVGRVAASTRAGSVRRWRHREAMIRCSATARLLLRVQSDLHGISKSKALLSTFMTAWNPTDMTGAARRAGKPLGTEIPPCRLVRPLPQKSRDGTLSSAAPDCRASGLKCSYTCSVVLVEACPSRREMVNKGTSSWISQDA
ncbi:hypothetical protein SAMN05444745_1052 [Arthrobacter sp. OV608]|nr:hypothetical protein SAMN05444745_1052 [Arthrobacter sp. OV608]